MDSLTASLIIRMNRALCEEGIGPWGGPEPADAGVLREAYEDGGHLFDTNYLYEAGFVDSNGTPEH